MAGSSLLLLIDDIASMLDDVATMTKVAATKTAGVLGDDLALNAEQVTGVNAERELPVVWAVAVGSLKNKAILVPAALLISFFIPWAVTPLLMIGGAYLCFEGFEKVAHKFLHKHEEEVHDEKLEAAVANPAVDMVAFEKERIQGAIRTDFILSAEIITISLGTVATAPIGMQIAVLVGIGLVMTIGVYGLVAGIVKLDDLGLLLSKRPDNFSKSVGKLLLQGAPVMMKGLSILGTVAMFTVGGGILVHGIPWLHHQVEHLVHAVHVPFVGGLFEAVLNAVVGLIAGALVLAVVTAGQKVLGGKKTAAGH